MAITAQIASALEAAHEKNIVHRDIKSANVMLTSKGDAKVLDFGLAQTAQSTKLTKMGSTLGTITYMSPEQAKGEEVDRRTDIWSLGVVLYEMIAGRAPYAGEYDKAVIYSILNEDPEPLTAVRTGVPMGLEWIVSKMLAKNAADRYQTAADLQVDLRTVDLAATTTMSRVPTTIEGTAAAPAMQAAQKSRPSAIPYIIGGVVGAALVFLAWVLYPTEPARRAMPPIRVSHSITSSVAPTNLAISPDGVDVAYVLPDGVHVLNLTSGQTRLLNGTENTTVIEFSPDGDDLLLTKTVSIDRIPMAGGAPLEIVRTIEGSPRASWGPDGWIIYEDEQQIFKYSEFRGEKRQLTSRDSLEKESDYDWPSMLPDGKTMMATLEIIGRPAKVRFFDFETGEVKSTINFSGYAVKYHEPGFLTGIVDREGLVAVPFDLESLTITGPRRSILANATVTVTSISANGTIVYSDRDPFGNVALPESRPAILTFPSFKELLAIPEGFYSDFRLSPDEKRLVYLRRGGTGSTIQREVVVYDFETGQNRPITRSDLVDFPVWTVGGDSVAYLTSVTIGSPHEIHVRAADGSGDARRIFGGSSRYREFDFSPDGLKMVRVAEVGPGAGLLRTTDL